MRSPFPGMDPYIEACGLWEDFHTKLIGEIERVLAPSLPHRYVVRTGERSYIDIVDPVEGSVTKSSFQPDVALRTSPSFSGKGHEPARVAVAEADPPAVVMHGSVEHEYREIFLEIHDLNRGRQLVTCIEVLSPLNKRPGTIGWQQYDQKRQVFLQGHANLVEIDLLRGGRRKFMTEPWPPGPYYLLVMRKEQAPECTVWPAHFLQRLPVIPVPLLLPDPDISLDLQPLIEAIYERSRYERDIDYRRLLGPPLSPAEATWLEQRLHEQQASG